jgi:hypothetical protein
MASRKDPNSNHQFKYVNEVDPALLLVQQSPGLLAKKGSYSDQPYEILECCDCRGLKLDRMTGTLEPCALPPQGGGADAEWRSRLARLAHNQEVHRSNRCSARSPQAKNKFSREIPWVSRDYPLAPCEKVDRVPLVNGRGEVELLTTKKNTTRQTKCR